MQITQQLSHYQYITNETAVNICLLLGTES